MAKTLAHIKDTRSDMAKTQARVEDTGPEYRSIYDALSVNLSKLVFVHSSDGIKGAVGDLEGSAPKIKVDFASVSAFVIPAHRKRILK